MSGEDRIAVDTDDIWPEGAEEEGVILDWRVQEGSHVDEGDVLCVFQAEKVDVDVHAPQAGTVDEIAIEEDVAFDRGAVVAYIAPE